MKSNKSISGITLIEILIGIVISMIMMGAMFTSYTVVNNSYSQVSDKAKISQSARNLVGMIIKDIRMAGFKYFNDTIKETNELIPIRITKALKGDFGKKCDQIEIVYGDVYFNAAKTPQYTYERFKITYFCEQSQIVDKAKSTANKVSYINALAVYKKKEKWDNNASKWLDANTDLRPTGSGKDERTYSKEKVVDYVQDLVFHAIDENGNLIDASPQTFKTKKDFIYKIKTVDIALTKRSRKEFFKNNNSKQPRALRNDDRNIKKLLGGKDDKYLRDTIIISANTRNLGLQ